MSPDFAFFGRPLWLGFFALRGLFILLTLFTLTNFLFVVPIIVSTNLLVHNVVVACCVVFLFLFTLDSLFTFPSGLICKSFLLLDVPLLFLSSLFLKPFPLNSGSFESANLLPRLLD